jgi:hypothetical protein
MIRTFAVTKPDVGAIGSARARTWYAAREALRSTLRDEFDLWEMYPEALEHLPVMYEETE